MALTQELRFRLAEGASAASQAVFVADDTLQPQGGEMGTLSGSQRKYLRGVAHSYKPAIYIGKEGLSDPVLDAIENAITARELIKIKIAADRDERERLVPVLEERLGAECVGTVGHMAILYREHPDPEKRTITFPLPK